MVRNNCSIPYSSKQSIELVLGHWENTPTQMVASYTFIHVNFKTTRLYLNTNCHLAYRRFTTIRRFSVTATRSASSCNRSYDSSQSEQIGATGLVVPSILETYCVCVVRLSQSCSTYLDPNVWRLFTCLARWMFNQLNLNISKLISIGSRRTWVYTLTKSGSEGIMQISHQILQKILRFSQ